MHQAQQSEALYQGLSYKRRIACPAIYKRSQKLNRGRHIGAAAHAELGVPESREQVVSSAALCLQEQLRPVGKSKKGKAFGKDIQQTQKLAVEISWADTSPSAVVGLVQDLVKQLDSKVRSSLCIAFWDVEAALLASDRLSNTIVAIDDDEAERMYSPTLLLVGVPTGQEERAIAAVNWRGTSLVLLTLDTNSQSSNFPDIRRSFKTVFAFEAFALKGWLRTTEGLSVRQVREGHPSVWRIFKRSGGGDLRLIGKSAERPSSTVVELALYNSSAAESPINRGIGAVRSVFGKK